MRHLLLAATMASVISSPTMAEECTPLMTDLFFCPEGSWEELDRELPGGTKVWTSGPDVTAKLVAQPIPSGMANNPKSVMDAIKDSVRASQDDPESVTFSEHYLHADARFDRGIIAYEVMVGDKAIQLHHSFMLADSVVLQFMTYSDATDDAGNLELHRNFVTSFKVIEGQQDA